MPDVGISVKDVSAGLSRTATTNAAGLFSVPNLSPGNFEMTVSAPGFTTQLWTSITVTAGVERILNVVMKAGDPKQVVRIAAPPALVSEPCPAVCGSANASTVRDTPLNGRDWAALATRAGRRPFRPCTPNRRRRRGCRRRTPPRHLVHAGEERRGEPQHGQPAAEEHGLAAMAREEVLALVEKLQPLALPPPRPRQQPVTDTAADEVAQVVADDGRRDRDDEDDRQRQVPLRRQHARRDQAGLARHGQRRPTRSGSARTGSRSRGWPGRGKARWRAAARSSGLLT